MTGKYSTASDGTLQNTNEEVNGWQSWQELIVRKQRWYERRSREGVDAVADILGVWVLQREPRQALPGLVRPREHLKWSHEMILKLDNFRIWTIVLHNTENRSRTFFARRSKILDSDVQEVSASLLAAALYGTPSLLRHRFTVATYSFKTKEWSVKLSSVQFTSVGSRYPEFTPVTAYSNV